MSEQVNSTVDLHGIQTVFRHIQTRHSRFENLVGVSIWAIILFYVTVNVRRAVCKALS
ncbi:Uncharacterised protein [Vibrio cholerae]|nr:Uncharacterised protein [Vibrio cholerae]